MQQHTHAVPKESIALILTVSCTSVKVPSSRKRSCLLGLECEVSSAAVYGNLAGQSKKRTMHRLTRQPSIVRTPPPSLPN